MRTTTSTTLVVKQRDAAVAVVVVYAYHVYSSNTTEDRSTMDQYQNIYLRLGCCLACTLRTMQSRPKCTRHLPTVDETTQRQKEQDKTRKVSGVRMSLRENTARRHKKADSTPVSTMCVCMPQRIVVGLVVDVAGTISMPRSAAHMLCHQEPDHQQQQQRCAASR